MRLITVIVIFIFLIFGIKGLMWLKSYRSPQMFGIAIHRIPTTDKVVALTYDDGPNPPYTDQILQVLQDLDVKATFFLLGEELEKHPEYVEKISSLGHDIGNHSWSHAQLIFKSPAFINNEINKTDTLIKSLGYNKEIHFRAPYGRKLFILPWILSSQNRKHILFDVAPDDWECPSVDSIVDKVMQSVKPGSIILFHDGGGDRSQTVQATRIVIEKLKADGYKFLTIGQVLANYY
jgi:peptidoglycan-N-acetylglucosamine deacetylase